jgi:hypothetical protein
MNKFLKFEPETEGWRKDSTTSFSIRARIEPEEEPTETRSLSSTTPPTLSRAEELNAAYGTATTATAARRRRTAGESRLSRSSGVVSGAERIRGSRRASSRIVSTSGASSSGGSSSGGY